MILYKFRNGSKLMNIFASHLQNNGYITVYSITTIFSCAANKLNSLVPEKQMKSFSRLNSRLKLLKIFPFCPSFPSFPFQKSKTLLLCNLHKFSNDKRFIFVITRFEDLFCCVTHEPKKNTKANKQNKRSIVILALVL